MYNKNFWMQVIRVLEQEYGFQLSILNRSEAKVDLVMIQTLLLFK